MRFQGAKKRPAKVKELNYIVTITVEEVLKSNKRVKYKAEHDYVLKEYQENFNFENPNIGQELYNVLRKRENEVEVQGKSTEAEQELHKISHLVKLTKKEGNIHYTHVLLVNVNGRIGKVKFC